MFKMVQSLTLNLLLIFRLFRDKLSQSIKKSQESIQCNMRPNPNPALILILLSLRAKQIFMEAEGDLIVTPFATFSRQKLVQLCPRLLQALEGKVEMPALKALLHQTSEWEEDYFYSLIGDQDGSIELENFVKCMVSNCWTTVYLCYFWSYNDITHIKFTCLQNLTFSVFSDCGYMTDIRFVEFLEAPNLVKLDVSNMEDGQYSLRPLRKAYFPQLEVLDLNYYYPNFKDIETLSQCFFPRLKELRLEYVDLKDWDMKQNWRAKMESKQICLQFWDTKEEKNLQKTKKKVKTE